MRTKRAVSLPRGGSDGVRVLLLWHPSDDAVTVFIEDTRAGQCVELAVQRDCALDAFYHPFAYAA